MRIAAGFLFAFLLLSSLPAAARDVAKTVFVGEMEIALPVMEGFKEVFGVNAQFDGLARQLVPPGNRLLGVYLLLEDAQAIKSGAQTAMKRYVIVQTLKDNVTIRNADDFAAFKRQVLAEAGADFSANPDVLKQARQVSKYIQENYDKQASVEIGETRITEAFIDEENALGISMLANVGVQVGAETRAVPVGLSLVVIDLKGKPLFATAYTVYSGAKDAEEVKKVATDFVRKMFLVNDLKAPALSGGAKSRAEQEAEAADERLNYAIVVTGLLSVLALAFFVVVPIVRRLSRGDRDESI